MLSKHEIKAQRKVIRNVSNAAYNNLKHIFLTGLKPVTGDKKVFAMAGIPGSGKTTFIKKCIASGGFPPGCFILSPDDVMEALGEYKSDFNNYGAKVAFEMWEIPTRKAAYRLLHEAIKLQANIIIDMGAASKEIFDLIYKLKNNYNYQITMYWLNIPLDIAIRRVQNRERYISKDTVWERWEVLKKLKPQYLKLVNQFYEIENTA